MIVKAVAWCLFFAVLYFVLPHFPLLAGVILLVLVFIAVKDEPFRSSGWGMPFLGGWAARSMWGKEDSPTADRGSPAERSNFEGFGGGEG